MLAWLSQISSNPFYEFGIILFLAALLGSIGQLLKQPLIVVFIFLGIVVGPSVLNVVKSEENLHLLADIGIAVLLFIVGLKLDLRLIQSIGKIALLTGLGQVIFTSLIGYLIGLGLGFSSLHSFYIAVALTFSSTIIIVKLLSDKKEIESLHGQIAIGFLIVQDIVVILVMILLSTLSAAESSLILSIGKTVFSIVLLSTLTLATMKWVIPKLSFFLAQSQELLTLFSIAWAVSFAVISELIGFSGEVGAFLAGISLASSPFRDTIGSRLVSLRDFLLLFFFVNLGANLDLDLIGAKVSAALIFSIFVLVGNPLIVLIIMGFMGYRKRTSFLAGLTVAQISEFSLIFAGLGLAVGHITEETVGLITLVGLITIGLSTYLILYSHRIYEWIVPALSIFERKNPYREAKVSLSKKQPYDLILFGVGRFGSNIAHYLDRHSEIQYLAVDFDPQVVKRWQEQGKPIIYGDIEDPDILEQVPFSKAEYIVSTIPERNHAFHLIRVLKEQDYQGKIYLTATQEKDLEHLKDSGADEILLLHAMAAENFYDAYLSKLLVNRAS